MLGAFVHGLEQAFQPLGERCVALRAPQPPGLLEVRLGEAAGRAFDFLPAAGLGHFLRGAQTQQQVGDGKARACH